MLSRGNGDAPVRVAIWKCSDRAGDTDLSKRLLDPAALGGKVDG
jgi:hypothetical protein